MKRQDLEHIIRASGAITDEYEFVIVGSTRLRIDRNGRVDGR